MYTIRMIKDIRRIFLILRNNLLRHFLGTEKSVRESADFRMPAMVPIVFYNGDDKWTALQSMREYQNGGVRFGDYLLNLKYYLIDLSTIEEDYILSTNTVIDNIMYCDKFRKKMELADALRISYRRIQQLDEQEQEEFTNWVKSILLMVCGNKEAAFAPDPQKSPIPADNT